MIRKVSAEDIAIRGNGTGLEYMCPTWHFVYIFFNPVFQVSTAKNEITYLITTFWLWLLWLLRQQVRWRLPRNSCFMMCNTRKEPLCNLQTVQAVLGRLSLPAYRLNGYYSIYWQTENVQIRLHGCSSGPLLFVYGIGPFSHILHHILKN